jgi:hypothetical protein
MQRNSSLRAIWSRIESDTQVARARMAAIALLYGISHSHDRVSYFHQDFSCELASNPLMTFFRKMAKPSNSKHRMRLVLEPPSVSIYQGWRSLVYLDVSCGEIERRVNLSLDMEKPAPFLTASWRTTLIKPHIPQAHLKPTPRGSSLHGFLASFSRSTGRSPRLKPE